MRISHSLVPASLLLAGCSWGVTPKKFPPAMTPAGAEVVVSLANPGGTMRGELYALDTAGMYLRAGRLFRIPWSRVASMDVLKLDDPYDVRAGTPVDFAKVQLLRPVARFPQGLPAELLQKVLQLIGQPAVDSTLLALADSSSRATLRFRDQRVAIEEGYHRLGPDFPGMGEHWVSVGALLRGTIDPARPALLSYADIHGRPTLVGIGFVTVVHGREQPQGVPGWPGAWHEHSGLFVEESSGAVHASPVDPAGEHIWVLHVWNELPNPAGRFHPDNWMLPFARLGVRADSVTDEAGRAASLLTGGDQFLLAGLADAGIDAAPGSSCATSVARAREEAASVISAVRDEHLTRAQVGELEATWNELAVTLGREHGHVVDPVLAPAHRLPTASTHHHER